MSGDGPLSGTAKSYQARVRARLRRMRRVALGVGVEEPERPGGVLDAVQPGDRLDRAVLEPALLLGLRVEEPVVAEVVGQHVGRHRSLDAIHQEERGAEHVTGRLHPANRRHRHLAVLTSQAHRVELVLETVRREDRHVLGRRRDPGDVLSLAGFALLGPRRVEDQCLRRHPVGGDPGMQRDGGLGTLRQHGREPLCEGLRDVRRVATRALHGEVIGRSLSHFKSIGGTCSSCQRWSSSRNRWVYGANLARTSSASRPRSAAAMSMRPSRPRWWPAR